MTEYALDAIKYKNKGIMLDTGHLMNTNTSITDEEGGVRYIQEQIEKHGSLAKYVRGMHLQQSLSGAYVKASTGSMPADFPKDYLEQFAVSYSHILKIDRHEPWHCEKIAGVIERLRPEYLVHEFPSRGREGREEAVRVQTETLKRGKLFR